MQEALFKLSEMEHYAPICFKIHLGWNITNNKELDNA
jgi:hypothetical protein